MPKLEAVAALGREQLEECRKPVGIGMKVGRQLKQDRTGLVAEQREAVFKQLEFDGERYFLKPLNPRYPISPMADDAKIIGVVVLTQIEE